MSNMTDPRDCGDICHNGWIVIAASGVQHVLDASGTVRLITTDSVARCLCPKGQALPQGYGVSIDKVYTAERLYELYVNGVPVVETAETLKRAAQIPKSRWTWSFQTFKASLGKRKEIGQHVVAAEAWVHAKAASRSDVVLFGPNGTGKTGLATAIALALIERQESALFIEARALFMEWRETFSKQSTESETAFLKRFVEIPTLILDEAGETQLTEFSTTSLKLLVDRRQLAERPTIMTVNIPKDAMDVNAATAHLATVFGPALYDRLREHAQFWALMGTTARKPSTKVLPFVPSEREND